MNKHSRRYRTWGRIEAFVPVLTGSRIADLWTAVTIRPADTFIVPKGVFIPRGGGPLAGVGPLSEGDSLNHPWPYRCEPAGGERMRRKGLSRVALCGLVLSCSSTTNVEERDLRLLDYSLSEVDGEALPGPLSSLPGLVIWEGDDGSKLTVANGHLSCAADGTAEEGYLFRLARQGSAVWDPIRVNLELTCELTGPRSVRFRNRLTGEVLEGKILERFDGCPVFEKRLPSLESLRIGYAPANSGAEFPAELEFSGPPRGDFLAVECLSG